MVRLAANLLREGERSIKPNPWKCQRKKHSFLPFLWSGLLQPIEREREREKERYTKAMAASIKKFLVGALREDQRLDGRRPFDSRRLTIKFSSREDGAAEVQLGQTHVLCTVSCQLGQPYPDQPNEGILVVHTEFSPMADPNFEAGRPSENAVELGRIIDRGLRESRAIDTESLCVLSGKAVWALRIDICVLDNGGNLIDAASIAALAALLSFRRPECSIAGTEGQDVIIHPPEVREPLPLIIHYLPISFTFGFFEDGELLVMDPSYKEELVMRGRLTVILTVHGDICAIQKGGGVGVTPSDILRCLRIASTKVADVTSSLKKAAEAHELERAQRKIKRYQKFPRLEDMKLMEDTEDSTDAQPRRVLHEKGVMANSLSINSSDMGSSSDESSDDSTDEEVSRGVRSVRVVTREVRQAMEQPRLPQNAGDLLISPLWKEVDESSLRTSTRLHVERLGRVQSSIVAHDDHSLVSQKFESLGIQRSEVGSVEGGASSSLKGKTCSLLDAVKWNNVKKKRWA